MIHETAIIYDGVEIGENVTIGPYCIIGAPAEHKTAKQRSAGVRIMDGAVLHGHVTVDSGTDGLTVIGRNAYLMKHVHVGHDCTIGDEVTAAPHACFGGHVTAGNMSNFGMHAVIHPRVVIGEGAMIGAGCVVVKGQRIEPWRTYVGVPANDVGWNSVGMDRNGVTFTSMGVMKLKWNLGE
ncbi:MAG TPA: hypothetical protein VKP88_08055 [Candidatus Paceibacterota bacterium]|nr:hypothetical protein [Candidatus Paceibacterota bacterium]